MTAPVSSALFRHCLAIAITCDETECFAPRHPHSTDACRLSYVEGRLKLAEKERQRALKAKEAVPEDGVSQEELAALNAKADANMAALLQEEADQKVSLCFSSCFCACLVDAGNSSVSWGELMPCANASITDGEHL